MVLFRFVWWGVRTVADRVAPGVALRVPVLLGDLLTRRAADAVRRDLDGRM
jgi:hypothetical protein